MGMAIMSSNSICATALLVAFGIAPTANAQPTERVSPLITLGKKLTQQTCGCDLEIYVGYPPDNPEIISIENFDENNGSFSGTSKSTGPLTREGTVKGQLKVTLGSQSSFFRNDIQEITMQVITNHGFRTLRNLNGLITHSHEDNKFGGVFVAGRSETIEIVAPTPPQTGLPEFRTLSTVPFFGVTIKR